MPTPEHIYLAIDLKSFYASVECVARGLDPLTTNLVVADTSRTEKTICLAVSPSLKAYGISGRARLFEAVQRVKEVNLQREKRAPGHKLRYSAPLEIANCEGEKEETPERPNPEFPEGSDDLAVRRDPSLALEFIAAKPRMSLYMQRSTQIYQIYLNYVAPEDMHVYSVDEVFIDAAPYLAVAGMTAEEFARCMIRDVLQTTGITATAGIGSNMYLAKVAMDIVAKHMPPDENGVRIAQLDELSYRRTLWDHRPLTDFWRVGPGYAKKLEANGLYTMGDIARCSLGPPYDWRSEKLLYSLFGVNAEFLIDHAWGWEPCTIEAIHSYKPESASLSSGQVLSRPYLPHEARNVLREMTDSLVLDLVEKRLMTDQIVLTVCYDGESLNGETGQNYKGQVVLDRYGRRAPKEAHGSVNLERMTSSAEKIIRAALQLFDRIDDPNLLVRRIYVVAARLLPETEVKQQPSEQYEQLDLFGDPDREAAREKEEESRLARERKRQEAILALQKKYGKSVLLKGNSWVDGGTGADRASEIGGHRA